MVRAAFGLRASAAAAAKNFRMRAPTGIMPSHQLNLEHPWPHLHRQLLAEQQLQRARRIQELEHCFPMMRRPDWMVYHRVMRKLRGSQNCC